MNANAAAVRIPAAIPTVEFTLGGTRYRLEQFSNSDRYTDRTNGGEVLPFNIPGLAPAGRSAMVGTEPLGNRATVLPLPGESFDGGTVIASAWRNDTPADGPLSYWALVLTTESGAYYRLVGVYDGRIDLRTGFENIADAVEAYTNELG